MRTAAEGATPEELRRDVERLLRQWEQIEALAAKRQAPALLYREPDLAVRVIREEFNKDYRGVVIDDPELYEEVQRVRRRHHPRAGRPGRALRRDPSCPIFERHHVHEQLHKALDRKVWLPSGGSLIIERTEALTVIDVNTGKNVGQLQPGGDGLPQQPGGGRGDRPPAAPPRHRRDHRHRLHRHGDPKNREEVLQVFRDALARDKTRTQVFDISELGLVEMTRKRVSEGLVESFSATCPTCDGPRHHPRRRRCC